MNRIMRNSGAALAAIFIAGSLTACGPGSASSSRSDTNPTEVSTDLGNKKYELTLWDGAGLKAVDEALMPGSKRNTQTSPSKDNMIRIMSLDKMARV